MSILVDLLRAVFYAGIPVAIISYYLIIFISKRADLVSNNLQQLKKELKTIDIKNNEAGFLQQKLQKKFIKFGGGFYGIMSLITYLHIELYQVIEFIKNFESFSHFIESIGFSMLLNFFIEAIMNLVTAFLWPIYWFKFMPIGSFWVWLIVAILAHWIATKYALQHKHINPEA